jgi:hypothetical protein
MTFPWNLASRVEAMRRTPSAAFSAQLSGLKTRSEFLLHEARSATANNAADCQAIFTFALPSSVDMKPSELSVQLAPAYEARASAVSQPAGGC